LAAGADVGAAAWRLSAAELARAYASGALDPSAHLEHTLARIAALNPRLNAIIALDPGARAAARDSAGRIAAGRARSALEGVPVLVKDSILAAGMPCTWGSRLFADCRPAADELPVARLRAAGAVILGKTNVPEFTLEGYTWNPLFGVTRNPWDLALTPGGSSGGAVAAVAAGFAPLAIGTDGGGSIRRPASHTGLVGLKPSIGRVARGPSLPQILLDMEVIGPIARTVEDASLLYRVIAGPDATDRRSLCMPEPARRDAAAPLSILYVPRFGDAPLDPEIAASVDQAAHALAAAGHRIEQRDGLPFDLTPIVEFWPLLGQTGVALVAGQHPGRESEIGERMRAMIEPGRKVPAARYLAGIESIEAFRRTVGAAFSRFDLIMTPTAAALPWPAEEVFPPSIDGRPAGPRGHAVYTGWVNACGHPAISIPCAPSETGLPIGFQLVGRYGADDLLIELARSYEAAHPWRERWPAFALSEAA
jgi:aspartyl-tRNA(Asn)/glutamyl-tRNA(Gln) amidotransferase subunit A